MLRDKESLISYFAANGDSSLDAVASFEALFHIEDDEQGSMTADWRPFEIKRASNEYKNFHKSLEEAIREIEKSNEFGSEFPDERSEILDTLRMGKQRIEEHNVSPKFFQRYFIDPLKWVSVQFAKSTVGLAASATLQELMHLLSHFL